MPSTFLLFLLLRLDRRDYEISILDVADGESVNVDLNNCFFNGYLTVRKIRLYLGHDTT
jgi:hypothetical protein